MAEDNTYCNANVARKVVYEFTMFNFLCETLRFDFQESVTFKPGDLTYVGTGGSADEDDRTTYALLESMLLHTRVLHDFFYKPRNPNNPRTADDIIASDFVPEWETLRPSKGEYLGHSDRKDRLDKALAHLTLRRVKNDSNEKQWNVDAIHVAIGNAIKVFLQNLPDERKPWFTTVN
jgi:hypothetical protein